MTFEDFREKVKNDGEYNCFCHASPPCSFCTDTIAELYEEWCEENGKEPIY